MRALLVWALVAGVCAAVARAKTVPCLVTDPDTSETYDLSALTRTSGSDWIANDYTEQSAYIYRVNVCHDLLYKGEAGYDFVIPADTGLHQQRSDALGRQHPIGKTASPTLTNGILTIEYLDGDLCDRLQVNRTAIVTFACDEDGQLGNPVFIIEDPDRCRYVFEWKTSAACPQKASSMSGFAVFLIILLVGIALYLILGFLYNRFVAGKKGMQQIPNYAFWSSVFGVLICCGENKVVRYSRVATGTGAAEELNPDEFDDDAIENGDEEEDAPAAKGDENA